MDQILLGTTVHLPDSQGTMYQGQIVAVWLVKDEDAVTDVRVIVACEDKLYRSAWLTSCRAGAKPETEEQLKERLRKRREKEGQ